MRNGPSWRTTVGQLIALLAVTAIAGAATWAWHPRSPADPWNPRNPRNLQNPQHVRADDAALAEGRVTLAGVAAFEAVLWVDARPRAAFDAGHAAGAVWLSQDDWDEGFVELATRWVPGVTIVVYCNDAACGASEAVAERLREELGLSKGVVVVLNEGWAALAGSEWVE